MALMRGKDGAQQCPAWKHRHIIHNWASAVVCQQVVRVTTIKTIAESQRQCQLPNETHGPAGDGGGVGGVGGDGGGDGGGGGGGDEPCVTVRHFRCGTAPVTSHWGLIKSDVHAWRTLPLSHWASTTAPAMAGGPGGGVGGGGGLGPGGDGLGPGSGGAGIGFFGVSICFDPHSKFQSERYQGALRSDASNKQHSGLVFPLLPSHKQEWQRTRTAQKTVVP